MCLYNPEKLETDGKDITVYKVLHAGRDEETPEYRSPYCMYMSSSRWEIGATNHAERVKYNECTEDSPVKTTLDAFGTEERIISDNAFHSFADFGDAVKELAFWACQGYPSHYVIGEFVIPHDTAYVYIGKTAVNYESEDRRIRVKMADSYASESLRLVRIIPEK